jgi:hypothetical protein
MKVALLVGGVFLSILLLIGMAAGAGYVSANNYAVGVEAQLRAARDQNKNVLAQYQQKVLEAVQVPEMYKNDFKEVISADVQGRYGAEGSKATMQWLKEHEVKFDSGLYTKLTEIIQGGRTDFATAQEQMIDIRRGYEAQQGYVWRGMWLRLAGFPKVNMADYKPITTDRVETTFTNGKEAGPLKLR